MDCTCMAVIRNAGEREPGFTNCPTAFTLWNEAEQL